MKKRVGIVGVSGYGGGETLRICAQHPEFEVVYVAGESSAGAKLSDRFPALTDLGDLKIEKWDPSRCPPLDLLFASLPTGQSREALAKIPEATRIVDIGGDHRYVDGWVYGLADVWPEKVRAARRVANPGCYPSAALLALAPLITAGIVEKNSSIIIDAKSGVSGAGRGGGDSKFSFAEINEDVCAYGLANHPHVREIEISARQFNGESSSNIVFTPHLIPMTRGILATCYVTGTATTEELLDRAREFYAGRAFVRIVEQPPHTKWASGSNLAFITYFARPENRTIVCLCAIDNLGKGAAGTAVQNANLMLELPEASALNQLPLWP